MPKKKKSKKKQIKLNSDIKVILLILVGIVLAILIYGNSGYMGNFLNEILGGIMGIFKYIVPIIPFVAAIYMFSKYKNELLAKIIPTSIILLCCSATMTLYQILNNVLEYNIQFQECIDRAFYLGKMNKGGGVIGLLISYPLVKLFEPVAALIIIIGIAIIVAVIVLRLKPSEHISNFVNKMEDERKLNRSDNQQNVKSRKQSVIQEDLGDIVYSKPETARERKQREKEERRREALKVDEQLTINMLEQEQKAKNSSNKNNDYIESNLFKQEEEKKEDKKKEVLQLEHALVVEDEHYEYPPVELLSKGKKTSRGSAKMLADTAAKLQKTLYSFGVSAKVENVSVGPTITRYELKPAEGTRVSKIANLADDIALNLAAETIRIEAPIPGKQAVGIEVPNKEKEAVHLREVIESSEFENNKSKLSVALGKDVAGKTIIADIGKMPHVLIAGSTGSGKSVCINSIITSIIYNAKPSEVKLVMVDPKVVELSVYNGIPHLLIPVVTDPKKAAGALAWAVQEMDDRYNKFAQKGVRDLKGYNKAIEKENENAKLPQIVIIIDELADLMMVAAKEVEEAICRLAQKARAAGMHLVIATQRPSVDVITGLIKANVPSRIAFAVSSQVDSRTILDSTGAEKLLGKGDMLFYPVGASKPIRIQGAFVSDEEVEKIVDFIKANAGEVNYSEDIIESIEKSNKSDKELLESEACEDDSDPFLQDAIETVIETGQASTSFIQRKFKVGYARAGRIIDQMEERGIISGYQGSKPREVLMSKEKWEELKMQTSENN
ncbi:dNA segregation ATPase FtsK/SpoIIIE family [Clostridium sp. CAG:492]|nr:dNA segregation ATPase FtsK/SpoIIIE family [Clostridium sp. CAG:492]